MEPADVVDGLVDAGVLVGTDDLALGEEYLDAVERWRTRLDGMDDPDQDEVIASNVDAPDVVDRLQTVARFDLDFVSKYLALDEFTDDYSPDDLIRILLVLNQVGSDPAPDDGAPDAFFPIHGRDIRTYTSLYERAIVYVWREDCPPCDAIRADFDEIFGESAEDVLLLAVYGPDCPAFLEEEFDVAAGPTTLFMRGGTVTSRIVGAPYPQMVEEEVDILREDVAQAN